MKTHLKTILLLLIFAVIAAFRAGYLPEKVEKAMEMTRLSNVHEVVP